jgi:hypothetical protein
VVFIQHQKGKTLSTAALVTKSCDGTISNLVRLDL